MRDRRRERVLEGGLASDGTDWGLHSWHREKLGMLCSAPWLTRVRSKTQKDGESSLPVIAGEGIQNQAVWAAELTSPRSEERACCAAVGGGYGCENIRNYIENLTLLQSVKRWWFLTRAGKKMQCRLSVDSFWETKMRAWQGLWAFIDPLCGNGCVLSLNVCWEWVEELKVLASYSWTPSSCLCE